MAKQNSTPPKVAPKPQPQPTEKGANGGRLQESRGTGPRADKPQPKK